MVITLSLTVSVRNTHRKQCGIISIISTDEVTTENVKLHKLRKMYPVTSQK